MVISKLPKMSFIQLSGAGYFSQAWKAQPQMAAFGSSTKLPVAAPFRCRVFSWPIKPETAGKFRIRSVFQITDSQGSLLLSALWLETLDVSCARDLWATEVLWVKDTAKHIFLHVPMSSSSSPLHSRSSDPLLANKHCCWYRWKYAHTGADGVYL